MDGLNGEIECPEEALVPGIYRTRDSIANFRFRVKIRRVETTAASSIKSDSNVGDSGAEDEEHANGGSSDSVRPVQESLLDEITVGWQEKVFNNAEFRYYSGKRESDFDHDVIRKKFFHDVQSMIKDKDKAKKASSKSTHRIYTVLDGEIIRQGDEEAGDELMCPYVPITTDPNEEPNHLSQLMADGLRRRRTLANSSALRILGAGSGPGGVSRGGPSDSTTIPKSNVIVTDMTRDTQLRLHALTTYSQTMVIRFDTAESKDPHRLKGGQQYEDYVDLCVLKLSETGVLEVTPDFTHGHMKPYRVEVCHKDEPVEIYEYWVEHISPTMAPDVLLKEALMMNGVYARQVESRLRQVGDDFEMPPNRMFRMLVNAEIVSAENFEYDNLFIHYFVELPSGWVSAESSELSGITAMSRTSAAPDTDLETAYYCHTFTLDLLYDLNRMDIVDKERMPKWPQLFVEVISRDSWTRTRTEGYGFVCIPSSAGSYDLSVDCWRPVRGGPLTEMRRYFLGGTPELADITYAGIPKEVVTDDTKVLSRYGFRTASSGTVRMRMNVVHQAKAFLGQGGKQLKRQFLMDRLSSASLFSSVSTVLSAFQKARERFQRISETYSQVNLSANYNDLTSEKGAKENNILSNQQDTKL